MAKANPFEKFLSNEDKHHVRVVNHIRDKLPEVIASHIPSEGKKSAFERYKHSIMGNLKGLPDFIFLHPKFKSYTSNEVLYHGLCIELKSPEHERVVKKGKKIGKTVKAVGKLSDEQADVLNKLNTFGFKAVCCFGADEAIKVIDEYFKDYYELKKTLHIRSNQTLKFK
jgi:hypothetical protein